MSAALWPRPLRTVLGDAHDVRATTGERLAFQALGIQRKEIFREKVGGLGCLSGPTQLLTLSSLRQRPMRESARQCDLCDVMNMTRGMTVHMTRGMTRSMTRGVTRGMTRGMNMTMIMKRGMTRGMSMDMTKGDLVCHHQGRVTIRCVRA